MMGGIGMVATKKDAYALIDSMTDVDLSKWWVYLNASFEKSPERIAAEQRFVQEVKAAEESVASGNCVTLPQLHEFLGV